MGSVDKLIAEADKLRINGKYEEAASLYAKLLEQDNRSAEAHAGLGLIYSFGWTSHTSIDPFQEAIKELTAAVDINPNNAQNQIYLAKAYQQMGMYEESYVSFTKVLELDPGNAEAEKQIAFLRNFGIGD